LKNFRAILVFGIFKFKFPTIIKVHLPNTSIHKFQFQHYWMVSTILYTIKKNVIQTDVNSPMPDYFLVIIWFVLTNNMYLYKYYFTASFFYKIIMRVYNISFLLKKKW